MPNETGKPGTMSVEDFETLELIAESNHPKLLATKVAKICMKRAAPYLHEYPTSLVGVAFKATAEAISRVTGSDTNSVRREAFSNMERMVSTYGAEVVVQKLAKIAKRQAKAIEEARGSSSAVSELKSFSDALKAVFPRSA